MKEYRIMKDNNKNADFIAMCMFFVVTLFAIHITTGIILSAIETKQQLECNYQKDNK